MDYTELFYNKSFWYFYQNGEEHEIDDSLVEKYATVSDVGLHSMKFSFSCPLPYTIELSLHFDAWSVGINLLNSRDDKTSPLGWWDNGRWHPFALRWEELDSLCSYWVLNPPFKPFNSSIGHLLLSKFVGNPSAEQKTFSQRKDLIASAYSSLSLFSSDEIQDLVKMTVLVPAEPDYSWSMDNKLGWVFSGEYPCYSIRNFEHSDGAEGKFPFDNFRDLMKSLKL